MRPKEELTEYGIRLKNIHERADGYLCFNKLRCLQTEGKHMKIRTADRNDFEMIAKNDIHISKSELNHLLGLKRVYLIEENDKMTGWLRYNLFWDSIPFMNMLYVLEPYRGKGHGKALVQHWETEMKKENAVVVMTSTVSEEYAQHFYHKLNYKTVGGFMPCGEPYEIILSKEL